MQRRNATLLIAVVSLALVSGCMSMPRPGSRRAMRLQSRTQNNPQMQSRMERMKSRMNSTQKNGPVEDPESTETTAATFNGNDGQIALRNGESAFRKTPQADDAWVAHSSRKDRKISSLRTH